jgi:hypothetical protein
MAINLLVGLPGGGKTSGVLKRVILPALKAGRTVITNIEGLFHDKIAAYLGISEEEIQARLVIVDKTKPYEPKFWYDEMEPEGCFVRPGMLVVLDESNRYFGTLAKDFNPRRPPQDKYEAVIWPVWEIFCREHRHYVDENGQSTDVWLLTQGFGDVKRKYHGVIDTTVLTTKLDFMRRPNEFKLFYYQGAVNPQTRGGVTPGHIREEPPGATGEPFDEEVGKLYHSHRGGFGKEVMTDTNKDFWGQRVFFGLLTLHQAKYVSWVVAAVSTIACVAVAWYMLLGSGGEVKLANGKSLPAAVPHTPGAASSNVPPLTAAGYASAPGSMAPPSRLPTPYPSTAPTATTAAPVPEYAKDEESTLTLVGFLTQGEMKIAVLLDKSARYRYVTDFEFTEAGPASYVTYQGKKVSRWTGPGLITTKRVETK